MITRLQACCRRAGFGGMEDRIAVLEKDVDAIKFELAVIRHDRMAAAEYSVQISHIELDLRAIKSDLSLVRKDVTQLQKDVAQLQKDVAQLQTDAGAANHPAGQTRSAVFEIGDVTAKLKA
jgi:uncharacterized small protein (DUF1192 family)